MYMDNAILYYVVLPPHTLANFNHFTGSPVWKLDNTNNVWSIFLASFKKFKLNGLLLSHMLCMTDNYYSYKTEFE